MTLPELVRAVRWMVRDTFRQSVATRLFWVMLAVTGVCVAVCLSVAVADDPPPVTEQDLPLVLPEAELVARGLDDLRKRGDKTLPAQAAVLTPDQRAKAHARGLELARMDGVRPLNGSMTLGFGAVTVPVPRGREDAVRYFQIVLAGGVGDAAGVLLALLWTAGFLPTFLEPQSATVLLAKPTPRWAVLFGKYLGVVLFVALQAVLFVAGTWLALGASTGVWAGAYWLAVPLLVVNFAVFYAVSAFLAVWTRSTVAAAFGVLLFWLFCWLLNYTHHRLIAFPVDGVTGGSQVLLEVGYWLFPKPLDLGGIFYDAMRADGFKVKPVELTKVQEAGRFHPELSVLASAAFAAGVLGLAAYEFRETDY